MNNYNDNLVIENQNHKINSSNNNNNNKNKNNNNNKNKNNNNNSNNTGNPYNNNNQQQNNPNDLTNTSNSISENIKNYQIKKTQIENQLKNYLYQYRQAKTPIQKANLKKKCLQLLKKKKMYEQHLNTLDNTQMMVESLEMNNQIMKDNMNIMNVMHQTIQYQKDTMHAMGGIDKMYDIMDDMQDLRDVQQEMNEDFQRNYDVDVLDEDLDAELDEIDYQMRYEEDANGELNQVNDIKNYDEKALEDALK